MSVHRSRARQRAGSALILVAAGTAVIGGTDSASAQSGSFVRGIGSTLISPSSATQLHSLGLVCGPAGTEGNSSCTPKATATMKVSTATKNKLGLESSTIAKGTSAA